MTDGALPQVVLQLTETAEKLAGLEQLVHQLGADIRKQAEQTARLQALEDALQQYEASGAVPYRTRSVEQFAGYFDGLELVEPGVVLVADWRPDPGADRGPEIPQMGAVGRKP